MDRGVDKWMDRGVDKWMDRRVDKWVLFLISVLLILAQNDRNIALPAFGTTCNESSVKYWEPQRYGCFYVMTDPGSWIQHNDAAGGWVRLQFNTTFTVTAVEISSLFRISEQCSIYELEFSTAKFLVRFVRFR